MYKAVANPKRTNPLTLPLTDIQASMNAVSVSEGTSIFVIFMLL